MAIEMAKNSVTGGGGKRWSAVDSGDSPVKFLGAVGALAGKAAGALKGAAGKALSKAKAGGGAEGGVPGDASGGSSPTDPEVKPYDKVEAMRV